MSARQQQPGERLAVRSPQSLVDAGDRRLWFRTWFVRITGLYNASAVVVLLTPGALELVGARQPYSPFRVWLPALMGLFAGIVLLLSSTGTCAPTGRFRPGTGSSGWCS